MPSGLPDMPTTRQCNVGRESPTEQKSAPAVAVMTPLAAVAVQVARLGPVAVPVAVVTVVPVVVVIIVGIPVVVDGPVARDVGVGGVDHDLGLGRGDVCGQPCDGDD